MIQLEKIKAKITRRHLLIVGNTEAERKALISKVIDFSNFPTYRFPSGMERFEDYIEFVRKKDLYTPFYHSDKQFNGNQLFDFHIDWFYHNNALVVLEEFHKMEERWRVELLRLYIEECENHKKGTDFIHLIASQEAEEGIIEKLIPKFNLSATEKRTKRQVVEGNLEVIDLSEEHATGHIY